MSKKMADRLDYGPPLNIQEGGGTLDDPDTATCPKCGGKCLPGYDEASDGSLYGDGTWACTEAGCGYFWDSYKDRLTGDKE